MELFFHAAMLFLFFDAAMEHFITEPLSFSFLLFIKKIYKQSENKNKKQKQFFKKITKKKKKDRY